MQQQDRESSLTAEERESAQRQGREAPPMTKEGLKALARAVERARSNTKGRREPALL